MQPYPPVDNQRLDRVIAAIGAELHVDQPDATQRATFARWVQEVLHDAQLRPGPVLWFLKNVGSSTLAAGQDLVDLVGHIHRLGAVYAPRRLRLVALETIVELRQTAAANNAPNAGEPRLYALEAGRRVHLWPAPAASTALTVCYRRPLTIQLVPDEWESLIVLGAIGRHGRHWDRDALVSRPMEYERRYEEGLRRARRESDDIAVTDAWAAVEARAVQTLTAGSASDSPLAYVVPASLSGIGALSIETGPYPLEVA